MKFKDLIVGGYFEFETPHLPFTLRLGPWVKVSARQYRKAHVKGQGEVNPAFVIDSVNLPVVRVGIIRKGA